MGDIYQVTATPVDTHANEYLIECSDCGPVGPILVDDPGPFVLAHIAAHAKAKEQT